MSDSDSDDYSKRQQEDKRIRRLYQSLLQRRPLNYWNILDFPYLAEIVRHDSSYLRRILNFIFADHPVLPHYLTIIACRQACQCKQLPVGFERKLWLMYKHQAYLSSVWSPDPALNRSRIFEDTLPQLSFSQFVSKINGIFEEVREATSEDNIRTEA